jgi:hypothetical protein
VPRSIFIGDVHGCAAELKSLLERVAPVSGDHVYFVGDLVARGPDTPGVLALVREVKGRSVRGNHEQRLLDARSAVRQSAPLPKLEDSHRKLLDELGDEDWDLIETQPLYLRIEEHDAYVVHAGFVPGIPIEAQSPRWMLTLRSINDDGSPSSKTGGTPWAARWIGPPHVVFGHDAHQRVQLHPWATGLDSGCVYGGELTALVLESGAALAAPAEREALLVKVPARRRYVEVDKLRAG